MEMSNNELLERIKVCVAYDLIGHRSEVMEHLMTINQRTKFTKQTNRLYDACMLMPEALEYINDRYDDIMKDQK